jgi:hypothetical protein
MKLPRRKFLHLAAGAACAPSQPTILDVPAQSLRAREAEWELGTLATDNIVRHSRRAEITNAA